MYNIFYNHDLFMTVKSEEEVKQVIKDLTEGNESIQLHYEEIEYDDVPVVYLWDMVYHNGKINAYPHTPRDRHFHPKPGVVRDDSNILFVRLKAPTAKLAIEKFQNEYINVRIPA